MSRLVLLIVGELLFEVFSQGYERGSILVTTNLPFDEWTEVFGSERLRHSRQSAASQVSDDPEDS